MKVLLDTQCWLWWFAAEHRLNDEAQRLIADAKNIVYFSSASSWEIAIKHSIGKLQLPEPPAQYVPRRLATQGMTALAIEHAHALHVASLPDHHKDPFDRLLVAQAQLERVPILTADRQIADYDVDAIWAGTATSPW